MQYLRWFLRDSQFGDGRGAHLIFKISFLCFAFIGTIGSCLLFFYAKYIANNLILIPEAEYSLICLAPSIFFVSISSVLRGYFNGMQRFSITAKSQLMEQILKTVFTITLVEFVVLIGKKNVGIMAGFANLATTIATGFSFVYIYLIFYFKRKEIAQEIKLSVNKKPTRIRKTIKEIFKVAMPISISSLISSFNKNIDSLTIVRFLKENISEKDAKIQYGILSGKVDSLCTVALSLNIAFVTAMVPNISKSYAKGNIKDVIKKSKIFILISIVIAVPISSILYIFPEQVLNLLFPNATAGAMFLRVSSISIIFMMLSQTMNGILQAIGKVKIPPISFGVGIIFKFICNITLIKIEKIGIYGAILGNIICNVIAFLISLGAFINTIKSKKIKNI